MAERELTQVDIDGWAMLYRWIDEGVLDDADTSRDEYRPGEPADRLTDVPTCGPASGR